MKGTGPQQDESSIWHLRPVIQTYISFGQILHEIPVTFSPGLIPIDTIDDSSPRAFSPALPSLSSLFNSIEASDSLPAGSLNMRFEPSPWQTGVLHLGRILPAVEMRFSVDSETKSVKIEDILAISDITSTDVMLPDRVIDLRFEQKTVYRDHGELRKKSQVQDFIQASQLDLEHGQLQTPPRIILPIPAAICKKLGPEKANTMEVDTVEVEYLFTGLDYRSTLHYEFDGWSLLYTSVEGGKAGGRRGELKLYPSSKSGDFNKHAMTQTRAAWQDEQYGRYIEAAYRLVDALETKTDPVKQLELFKAGKIDDRGVVPISRMPINSRSNREDRLTDFKYFYKPVDLGGGDQIDAGKPHIGLAADELKADPQLGSGEPNEQEERELNGQ